MTIKCVRNVKKFYSLRFDNPHVYLEKGKQIILSLKAFWAKSTITTSSAVSFRRDNPAWFHDHFLMVLNFCGIWLISCDGQLSSSFLVLHSSGLNAPFLSYSSFGGLLLFLRVFMLLKGGKKGKPFLKDSAVTICGSLLGFFTSFLSTCFGQS